MQTIQSNLINFSKINDIFSLFEQKQDSYSIFIDEHGIVYPDVKHCPICKSKMAKNGYNRGLVKTSSKFNISLRKGKLKCTNKSCNHNLSTDKVIFEVWKNTLAEQITNDILDLKLRKLSSQEIARHIENTMGIKISHEFVRLKSKEMIDEIPIISKHKFSGVLVSDEEFVKSKGIELKRISIIDANNPNVYHDKLYPDRSFDNLTHACSSAKEILGDVKAVVSDGFHTAKLAYKTVFGKNIKIQNCLFHFLKNVRDEYKQSVGIGKGKATLPLQNLIDFYRIANIFFHHEREIIGLIELQNELNAHLERIKSSLYNLKDQEKYSQDYKLKYSKKAYKFLRQIKNARRRVKGIKLDLREESTAKNIFLELERYNNFPKGVVKQLKRLKKDWINFTHCMRDRIIPPTSNKVEQFYGLTLNWIEKNNLQSEDEFYFKQKINLVNRYKIPFIKEGSFQKFLKITALMLLFFG